MSATLYCGSWSAFLNKRTFTQFTDWKRLFLGGLVSSGKLNCWSSVVIIFPWRKLALSKSQHCSCKVNCLWNEKSSRPNIIEWKDNIRWNDFYLHFASSQSIVVHRHWSRGEIQSPSHTSLSVLESRSHWQFFPKITSISNQMPWNPSKVIPTVTYKQAHFVYAMHVLTPSDKVTQSNAVLEYTFPLFLQQFK